MKKVVPILKYLGYIFAFTILTGIFSMLFSKMMSNLSQIASASVLLSHIVLMVFSKLVLKVDFRIDFSVKHSWGRIILLFLLSFVIQFVLGSFVESLFPDSLERQDVLLLLGDDIFLLLVTTLLIAPFFEELLFRRMGVHFMGKEYSNLAVGVITSLVFGLSHLQMTGNLVNRIYPVMTTSIMGAIAYSIYRKDENISSSMIYHFLFNIPAALITILLPYLL